MVKNEKFKMFYDSIVIMTHSILMVEDDICAALVQRHLEGLGHVVILYQNGQDAVDSIEGGWKYDLLMVDSSLKDRVDGADIIRLSKEMHPQIPIISISGHAYTLPGVNTHLPKPFNLNEIARVIGLFLK